MYLRIYVHNIFCNKHRSSYFIGYMFKEFIEDMELFQRQKVLAPLNSEE